MPWQIIVYTIYTYLGLGSEKNPTTSKPGVFHMGISPPVRWGLLDFMSACRPSSRSLSRSFSSCLAGPQPRLCEISVACRTSTAIPWVQCCVPDLNRDPVRSVLRAGPQLRSREFSVACRTSTAIVWDQCCVPDLNSDPVSSVLRAGPQPRSCEISVARRTSTAIPWVQCCAPDLNRDRVRSVLRAGPQQRSRVFPKLRMLRKRLKHVWNCLLCGSAWRYFSCRKNCAKRSTWFHQMTIASANLAAIHVPSCSTAWRCRSMCAIWQKNWSRTSTLMVVPRQHENQVICLGRRCKRRSRATARSCWDGRRWRRILWTSLWRCLGSWYRWRGATKGFRCAVESSSPTDCITAFASHDLPSAKAYQVCARHDLCGSVPFDSRRGVFFA